MNNVPALFLIVIITQLLIIPSQANAQHDKDDILRIRNESNAALKNSRPF